VFRRPARGVWSGVLRGSNVKENVSKLHKFGMRAESRGAMVGRDRAPKNGSTSVSRDSPQLLRAQQFFSNSLITHFLHSADDGGPQASNVTAKVSLRGTIGCGLGPQANANEECQPGS
jgi:hypothetical protein